MELSTDFEDAVVQTPLHRVADVHVRSLPNTLEALELLDFRSVVVGGSSLDSAQVFRVFLVGHAGEIWRPKTKWKLSWRMRQPTTFFFPLSFWASILSCQLKIIV